MTGERGAMTILMIALCALVATIGIATTALGVLFDAREQAATAAEAAALAAAVATYPPAGSDDPEGLAADLASRNGARLVSCSCSIDPTLESRVVVVTVALEANVPIFGDVLVGRTARAEFEPRAWLGR